MSSVYSSTILNKTLQQKIINQLETALSGIHALRNPQIALDNERLEHAALILQQTLEMVGEITSHINDLLGKMTNHLEPGLEFEGMYFNASNPFSRALYPKMTQHKFMETFALTDQQHLLEVQTFKHLEIRLSGKPVRFPFAKCSELIVWLALNGAASKDQICDELWNGAATRSNLEYFRVVVRRSRKALVETGQLELNPLIFEQGLYQLSPKLELQVDALEFAKALKNQSVKGLEQALDLYQGEFMPYTTSEWANLKRTAITDLALETAVNLAQNLEQHQPRQAIEIYKRALEIDALSEIASTKLIGLLEQFGESSAAQAVRGAYQKMLE
jgi:two-component SAPR family response regulator